MITVSIAINGTVIMARTAVNITAGEDRHVGDNLYEVDDGTRISHNPDKGAVELAKKMLDTIKEVKE